MGIRSALRSLPVIGPLLAALRRPQLVESVGDYWESRYSSGGNSGSGSYGRLAEFKAEIINDYVAKNGITSVMEFGSGDGAQLALARYPEYTGVDVSQTIVDAARAAFAGNDTIKFLHTSEFEGSCTADLTLSLDVVYHLVHDEIFQEYMARLFAAARRSVIVYSSNYERQWAAHVRHRRFTDWVEKHRPDFKLVATIPNRFPFDQNDPDNTSFADFYIFERA
jgi:hypothetical protein